MEEAVEKYFNSPTYFTLKAGIKLNFCFSQSHFSILKEAAEWDSYKKLILLLLWCQIQCKI